MNPLNPVAPINSQAYWEGYFSGLWDQNNGRGQTTCFMQCLVQNLPEPEKLYLSSRDAEVLDWGCAFGDGVAVLGAAFPQCRIAGLDFAEAAILEARRSFPAHQFIHADGGRLDREFDVIITSNCLEHFDHPLEIVESHLRWCREFYVALVPYREAPLIDCHRAQFREECFPEKFCGFTRVLAQAVDVDQNYWTGQQLLVVYASQAYGQLRPRLLQDAAAARRSIAGSGRLSHQDLEPVIRELGFELAAQLREVLPASSSTLTSHGEGAWSQLAPALAAGLQAQAQANQLEDRHGAALVPVAESGSHEGAPVETPETTTEHDLVVAAGLIDEVSFDEAITRLAATSKRSRKYVLALTRNASCYWSSLDRLAAVADGQSTGDRVATTYSIDAAFAAAGLTVVGRTFVGKAWTEALIRHLMRGDAPLRDQILKLHRSSIAPASQQAHVVAILGCRDEATAVGGRWQSTNAMEEASTNDWRYAVADALGLATAEERRGRQLQSRLEHCESKLRTLLCGPPVTHSSEAARLLQLEAEQREALLAEVARLQDNLAGMENSRSWRLTRPLRMARGTLAPAGSDRARLLRAVRTLISRGPRYAAGRGARWVANHTPPAVVAQAKELARTWLPDRVRLQLKSIVARHLHSAAATSDTALIRQRVDEFLERAAGSATGKLFLIVSGTSFTTSEGQRPTRIARELARREIPVLFAYWRWNTNEPLPAEKSPHVLEIPFDWLVAARDHVFARPSVANLQRSLLVEFPHSSLVGLVNEANVHGWRTIYDVIDDWEEFHLHGQAVWYEQDAERYLAHNADMVTVTCPALATKPILAGLRHVKLVPNAFETWTAPTVAAAPCAATLESLTVGYFGHLTRAWFDWELIVATAQARPGWTFEIIGYGFEGDMPLPANVKLLGKREHAELPGHAARWNAAMIPFRTTKLTAAVDPIKIYEYISLGLPTVVTGMPHLAHYPGVHCADGPQAFQQAIVAAAAERLDAGTIDTFLADNRWVNRVDTFLELVQSDEHVSAVSLAIAAPVDRQERAA